MTNFEPLREMGAFTEEMFNRIIAFQEREHPAWDTSLGFEKRLQGLPLHNLIFSNPDRDPAQYGPTIAPYFPLREEMRKIAAYVHQVSTQAMVCDLFPGNGFIGSLLGREGLSVTGLQHPEIKPNQIAEFYDDSCFRFSDSPLSQQTFDAALISWPPSGVNPTPLLTEIKPNLLIYIYSDHIDPETGQRQTGSTDMFAELEPNYNQVDSWQVERPKDILHEIWPDMTPSIEEIRQVKIFALASIEIEKTNLNEASTPYDWEKDLHMALLALQAKREMQSRGFPV